MDTPLRRFLEIPYEQLEEMNLEAKSDRLAGEDPGRIREARMKYLADEKGVKAVTVCFTDLEGRFHMLDYDKKFLLKSADNLTFDGSSIRGFSRQAESDLRLAVDWAALHWLPADVFGPGKVLVFGDVEDQDGAAYAGDLRARLKGLSAELQKRDLVANVANEIEGFIFQGRDAERHYFETGRFDYVSTGGYYHALPGDTLRRFIDTCAEVQRALGFGNEKDHPEVAPSQFEMNYGYTEASMAADQVQLYKLIARQVAAQMDLTASFLPKPVANVNGSGCHTNLSVAKKGKNIFFDRKGDDGLSPVAWGFINRILANAGDICLILNSSVNAYRRRATRGRTRTYQGNKDPVFCHRYPTGPCVGGNPGVRSARDTVASARWAGSRTAREGCDCQPHGGRELGLKDRVNTGEPLLSRRDRHHAKEADRHEPKGGQSGRGDVTSPRADLALPAVRRGLRPSGMVRVRNVVSPTVPTGIVEGSS